MGLSESELSRLSYHCLNNNLRIEIGNNSQHIVDWYDSIPSKDLKDICKLLSIKDRKLLFSENINNWKKWYSLFNEKIENQETIDIPEIENQENLSNQILYDLISNNLLDHSLHDVLINYINRNLELEAYRMLLALVSSGVLEQYTLFCFLIEFGNNKRWGNLGLSECPNLEEIENIII